ncbi:MAG: hypothetical protein P8M22_00610 [Phycisphaerales bacterium]|nr:hypothetical protein [Phycisphaerales bacterium]
MMHGIARDRRNRRTSKWQVMTEAKNACILEPLAILAASHGSGWNLSRSAVGPVLEDMPDLPEGCGDAGQGSNMSDAEDPAGDLLTF